MVDRTAHLVLASLCAVLATTALAACRVSGDGGRSAPILLFSGAGTSPGDVAALRNILNGERLNYSAVNSRQLNGMSESQIREYRLLIVPGGNFEKIGNGLTSSTTTNIRSAVQNGLNYLGICAGAFFAGNSPFNGLNLTSGSRFGFYAAEARGIRKAAVAITVAEGRTFDHYWEDGPQLRGWGAVVGEVSRRNPSNRGRDVQKRLGDSHGRSPRGAGELAPRNGLQNTRRYRQRLRGNTDPRRPESTMASALLTQSRTRWSPPALAWIGGMPMLSSTWM